MGIETARNCSDQLALGFDENRAAEETWEAFLSAGVFVGGNFDFASGVHATLKADAGVLLSHPRQLQTILGHFVTFPCVLDAEVLVYVPDGMRKFTEMVGEELNKPVAHSIKPEGAERYEFIYESKRDRDLALSATRLTITEDIVTTLGSVAGMKRILRPDQSVHSLAMLLRGQVNPNYQRRIVDHYLLEMKIPLDKQQFAQKLVTEWSSL